MPAADGCRRTVRAGAAVVERLERRWLCANAGAPGELVPISGDFQFYQLVLGARIEPAGDEDWFGLGRLRAGDVVSVAQSGAASGRGTLSDRLVELYRAGNDMAAPQLVIRDNDGGAGRDALILRQPLTVEGDYFVRAKAGFVAWTGTYALAAWVETRAGPPGEAAEPGQGEPEGAEDAGGAGESEPNGSAGTADELSGAWRPVRYVASWEGNIEPGAAAVGEQALELRAGDEMTVVVDSAAGLDAAVAVVDELGESVLALDPGDSNRRSGDTRDAQVFALRLPHTAVYRVRVWGNQNTGGEYGATVYLSRDEALVVGRHVFYNNSVHDEQADDEAVAPDKAALPPEQMASLANITNFTAGINGIMIDIKDLREELRQADFEFQVSDRGAPGAWIDGPAPASITRRAGAGAGVEGADRITIIWPDGSIVDRWLRVTLKASKDNGLAADDMFLFGNLVGETGDDPAAASVTAGDVMRTRAARSSRAGIANGFDLNRDGRVNAVDQAIARAHVSRTLPMFSAVATQPAQQPAFSDVFILGPRPRTPTTRRLWYDPDPALFD